MVGRRRTRVQRRRRPAPRDARARVGVLRLRRPGGGDRVVAARGCGAGRLRRRRRAPWRRRAVHLLRRPTRADDLDPRVRAVVLPRAPATPPSAGGPGREGARSTCRCPRSRATRRGSTAFREVVPAAVAAFAPDVLVTQLGCDTHATDPLAHLQLTTAGLPRGGRRSCTRWRTRRPAAAGWRPAAAATSGRAWSRAPGRSYFAEMAGAELPDELPVRGSRRRSSRSARGPGDVLRAAAGARRDDAGAWRRCGAVGRRTGDLDEHPRPSSSARSVPRARTPKLVRGLVTAGADGVPAQLLARHARRARAGVELVRDAEAEVRRALAVLADLPGPKVRLGPLEPDPLTLAPGQRVRASPGRRGRRARRGHDLPGSRRRPEPGDRVLLADGAVELTVTAIDDAVVPYRVRARRHGPVRPRGERARPNGSACRRSPTATARVWRARSTSGVDFVAQSFVRAAEDIAELRAADGGSCRPDRGQDRDPAGGRGHRRDPATGRRAR